MPTLGSAIDWKIIRTYGDNVANALADRAEALNIQVEEAKRQQKMLDHLLRTARDGGQRQRVKARLQALEWEKCKLLRQIQAIIQEYRDYMARLVEEAK